MPWEINERTEDGKKQWCVVKKDDGSVVNCHPDEESAKKQLAALYVNAEKAEDSAFFTVDDEFADSLPDIGDDLSVKAIGEDRVGGYLVVWGSPEKRDVQGEYFTKDTNFELARYPVRPAFYHHRRDPEVKNTTLGVLDTFRKDEKGLWVEGDLGGTLKYDSEDEAWIAEQEAKRQRYVNRVMTLVRKGKLGWSSGADPKEVMRAKSGEITHWPIIEGSLTPTPAEFRMTEIREMQSAYKSIGVALEDFEPSDGETADKSHRTEMVEGDTPLAELEEQQEKTEVSPSEGQTMNRQQMSRLVARAVKSYLDHTKWELSEDEVASVNEEAIKSVVFDDATDAEDAVAAVTSSEFIKSVADIVKDIVTVDGEDGIELAIKSAMDKSAKPVSKAGGAGRTSRSEKSGGQGGGYIELRTPFHKMSAEDMSYYISAVNLNRRSRGIEMPWQPDERFLRELADKAAKEYNAGTLGLNQQEARVINAVKSGDIGSLSYNPYRGYDDSEKADELDHTANTGYGAEWIPTLWTSSLWERARLENLILPLFGVIEMPSATYTIPLESTDPTVYLVPETKSENQLALDNSNNPIPDSRVGTANTTITAKKLGLRVGYSTELEEDSIIPFTAQLRVQAQRAILDALDNVILNGDNDATASTNINLIDGTPAATAKYLIFDGLLVNALVNNTANKLDGAGLAPSLKAIRDTRFLMSPAYSLNPRNVVYIMDASTYAQVLNLPEYLTMQEAGGLATNINGALGVLDGSPIIISAEMALANSAGKIPAAGGTLGRILVVHPQASYVGYRRHVSMGVDYIRAYDSFQLTATVRVGFVSRDTEGSSVLFNLAV